MEEYTIRRPSGAALTATGSGYVWASTTLGVPVKVDRDAAKELVDLYGGSIEKV